jgi:hypothetical protein
MTGPFIIESFWQKAANCVSIVLIKAAILRYGLNHVFKKERRSDQWLITLKDKSLITLSDMAIRRINKKNKIAFTYYKDKSNQAQVRKLRDYAELCFAVMVRYLQLYGYEGREFTESSAIQTLTREGINTDHVHLLLGLKRKTAAAHKLTVAQLPLLRRKKAILLYSDVHITLASDGYFEEFGKAVPISNDIPVLKARKAKYWFELK